MKKTLIIIIAIVLFSNNILAQHKKNYIGFNIGYNQGYLKDEVFSPLNYSEGGKLFGLMYKRQNPTKKYVFETNILFGTGKLKTVASDFFKSGYLLAFVDLSYLKKISTIKAKNLSFYIGGQYQSQLQYLDWKSRETFSFTATHGINIRTLANYTINKKSTIQSSVAIPIFQILVRPPYNGINEFISANEDNTIKLITTGKTTTLNKYFAINWQTMYNYNFSKRFGLCAAYTMRYQRVSDFHKLKNLHNQFTTGVNFIF
jgi:hypothetical protein